MYSHRTHDGLVDGFRCPISGKAWTTTSGKPADIEECRTQQIDHTTAVVESLNKKFGSKDRTVEEYRFLHLGAQRETNK